MANEFDLDIRVSEKGSQESKLWAGCGGDIGSDWCSNNTDWNTGGCQTACVGTCPSCDCTQHTNCFQSTCNHAGSMCIC